MTLYSKTDPSSKEGFHQRINDRWGQLHALEKDWAERAMKYLFLTNSGGAIATLSFIGAEKGQVILGTKIALFLFVSGIVLVGISTAKTFHHMSTLFEEYRSSVNNYFNDKITYSELTEADESRAKDDYWDYIIPYTSFACFVIGCGLGAYALFA